MNEDDLNNKKDKGLHNIESKTQKSETQESETQELETQESETQDLLDQVNEAKIKDKLKTIGKNSLKENSDLETQVIEWKNKYFQLLADQENLRKRLQREKEQTLNFAIEKTIVEFLPIIDNFENALSFAEQSSNEIKQWATGFQMILSQLRDVIYSHGIVSFHSKGNMFDPYLHEAMEIVETNEHLDGTILEEFAKGYKGKDRIIRPAKVKIARTQKNVKENIKKIKKEEEK